LPSFPALAGATGAWTWDLERDVIHGDALFASLCGVDPAEIAAGMAAEDLYAIVAPDDRLKFRIAVAGIRHGTELFARDFRVVGGGDIRWLSARGRATATPGEATTAFSGILVNVTEQKRFEERLRIVQTAGGVGTFEYVEGFGTVEVSREFCNLLGLRPTDAIAVRTINNLVHASDPPLISIGGDASGPLAREFRMRRADTGEARWLAVRGERRRMGEKGGYRVIGVVYDITDSKIVEEKLQELARTLEARVHQEVEKRLGAEEALRQAQKMEAVGQLTGGIAHDFNNLLTGIMGGLDMIKRRIADGRLDEAGRFIDAALSSGARAASLVQRLLAFSRRQTLDPRPTAVNGLLVSMEDLLRRTIGENIELVTDLDQDAWMALADENQLESAVLNLAINARDAMPHGGRIRFSSQNVTLGAEQAAKMDDLAPGDYVAISIEDTGHGMSPAVAARVFDPFFTTKPIGQGTGLGLSMVYGFVRQSDGRVVLESQEGVGTSVTLYLPRHFAANTATTGAPAQPESAPVGDGETILVVEDDEQVRLVVVEALRELGYQVLESSQADAAILQIQSRPRLDLLITDVGLPGLNGRQLAELARGEHPGLPVLFITCYAANILRRGDLLLPGMDAIAKPFSVEDLARKVREVMNLHESIEPAG